MMTRRNFSVAAILGSLFSFVFGVRPMQANEPQTVPEERDCKGSCVAQAYKLCKDGVYRHVKRSSLKAGDTFVMIGVDGDRLWRVEQYKVGEGGHFFRTTGRKIGTESVYLAEDGQSAPVHILG